MLSCTMLKHFTQVMIYNPQNNATRKATVLGKKT